MATRKDTELKLKTEDQEIDEELDKLVDDMTVAVQRVVKKWNGPTVAVTLPEPFDPGDGVKIDRYEHVTIANEQDETCYKVLRGETVDVPVPVFMALKAKYPKI